MSCRKVAQSLPGLVKVEGSFAALYHCCSSGRRGASLFLRPVDGDVPTASFALL